jgi:putative tryptophan/tyrosine transport system substrate-binding protein
LRNRCPAKDCSKIGPASRPMCALGTSESFNRPTGNLTGLSIFLGVLGPKHVELLHELLPSANAIAVLGNPGNANFKSAIPDI